MKLRRGKIMTITSYIVSIIIYVIISLAIYNTLIKLHYYYLFITIPLLFLFFSLICYNFVKIVLVSMSLLFEDNDTKEIEDKINQMLDDVNRIFKYVLIGIFMALLTSIMILDIIFCISKGKYEFVAISIVIWILLYYILFIQIVKMVKKEIRL